MRNLHPGSDHLNSQTTLVERDPAAAALQAVRALQTPSVWQAAAAAALQAAGVLFTFNADPDGDLVLVAACPGCPGRGMLTVAKGGAYRCNAGCGVSGTDALLSALVRHLEAGAGVRP